jgi:hypothetical protein
LARVAIEVRQWLRNLGLEQYAPLFHDNDIDGAMLHRLTADDLRDLGITSVGHRRRLLDAVAAPNADEAGAKRAETLPVSAEAERRQLTILFLRRRWLDGAGDAA